MFVIERYLIDKRQEMADNGIRCSSIGKLSELPESVQKAMSETQAATAHCSDIDFLLALNYGGRDDICRAIQQLVKDQVPAEKITEKTISTYLDTSTWPDPEMILRTSGELRISNFLLWQASYAELCPVDVYWPDFTKEMFEEAVTEYQRRNRRFGGTTARSTA